MLSTGGGAHGRGAGPMKPQELAVVRAELLAFAGEMFTPFARADQRRWGEIYLRGLMVDGRRKSIEPMAARLADGDEQCLQQFVNQSPWEVEPVRQRLARRMVAELAPLALIVDDTGFPKAGRYSVGVARQYSGTLGKVGNCQIGVSVSAASEQASCPLDWRLFLPEAWDADEERRAKGHLPAEERHREKWRLALEMIDELRSWGVVTPPIVADAGYGEISAFRLPWKTAAWPTSSRLPARPAPTILRSAPSSLPGVAAVAPRPGATARRPPRCAPWRLRPGPAAAHKIAWREGSRGTMRSRFLHLRCRPANIGLRRAHREALPAAWLLAEWPVGAAEPVKYWLANLPAQTGLAALVRLAKLRWRIELDYREMKDALGLDHFEGRSFRGWHHHVTLVSLAHGFLTLQRLSPKAHAPV